MYSFAWICAVPFQRGRAGDAPGGIFGAGRVRLCVPGGFLKAACPGKRPCSGRARAVYRLVRGTPKARRVGALSPARPGRGCKVLPFGFLASPAPVVVRTYWYCRCHLGRVWVSSLLLVGMPSGGAADSAPKSETMRTSNTKKETEVSPRLINFVLLMYKQLTSEQRSQIFAYLQDGIARKIICERVGISQSTLCRELKRNSGKHGKYTWQLAHQKAMERRERICTNRRTPSWIVHKALRLLREEDWSPKQISGYLGLKGINISHERIYREVRADETGELRAHCRHKMKYRRHKGHKRKTSGRTLIPNRISIHQRPAEADGTRFGDWEMDLVIGKGQKVLF